LQDLVTVKSLDHCLPLISIDHAFYGFYGATLSSIRINRLKDSDNLILSWNHTSAAGPSETKEAEL